jgi:hypothetical protein
VKEVRLLVAVIAVGDLAAWALVVVSAGLVIATTFYTLNTRRQVEEMRAARELATAPDVIAYLHVDHRAVAGIAIKNIGKGIAREIKIRFDPDLRTSKDFDPMKMSIVENGMDSLIPDQEIVAFLDLTFDYFKLDLPVRYRATIDFSGGINNKRYMNHCAIDFQAYKGLKETPLQTVHELVKAVEAIEKKIK